MSKQESKSTQGGEDVLLDILFSIDPEQLIPVLEKGLEIVKIEALVTDEDQTDRQIRNARILLSFLHGRLIGTC